VQPEHVPEAATAAGPPWSPLHSAASIIATYKYTYAPADLVSYHTKDSDPARDVDNETSCSKDSFRSSRTASQCGASRLLKSYQRAAARRGEPIPETLEQALKDASSHRSKAAETALVRLPPPKDAAKAFLSEAAERLSPTELYSQLVNSAKAGGVARLEFERTVGKLTATSQAAAGSVAVTAGLNWEEASYFVKPERALQELILEKQLHLKEPCLDHSGTCTLCCRVATESHMASALHLERSMQAAGLTWLLGPVASPRTLFTGCPARRLTKKALKAFWGNNVGSLHLRTAQTWRSQSHVELRTPRLWRHGTQAAMSEVVCAETLIISYKAHSGHYLKKSSELSQQVFRCNELPEDDSSDAPSLEDESQSWWPVVLLGFGPQLSTAIPDDFWFVQCVMYCLLRQAQAWGLRRPPQAPTPLQLWQAAQAPVPAGPAPAAS
jgi:hypothetical protein